MPQVKFQRETLLDVVQAWHGMLNQNARAAVGINDLSVLGRLVIAWIEDTTSSLRDESKQVAFVDPQQMSRLRDVIAVTLSKLTEMPE